MLMIGALLIGVARGAAGAVELIAASANGQSGNTASLELATPAGTQAGDLLLAQIDVRDSCLAVLLGACIVLDNNNVNPPAGWTLLRQDTGDFPPLLGIGVTRVRQAVFWRIAVDTEPASSVWTFSRSGPVAGGMATFRGVDPVQHFDAHSGQGGHGTTVTAPSVTTTPEALLVGLFGAERGNPNIGLPDGMGDVYVFGTGGAASGMRIRAASEPHPPGGATGNRSASFTGQSASHVGQLIGLRPTLVATAPHHIRLIHDGQGVTCLAETVTIRACANSGCSATYDESVTVSLTSPASRWDPNPVTFSGGEIEVALSHTAAGTVTLDAQATYPTADNPTQCINTGTGAPCELLFTDVGILIDGDDSDALPESAIPSQIAAKPSNSGFRSATQRVRVVRTDDQSGACIAGVENQTLTAVFNYTVPTEGEGLGDNTVTISGENSADLTTAGDDQSVQLLFDGNGTAPFSFLSLDAGQYQLNIAMNIPVTDMLGAPTGESVPASDASNAFVVRPLALFADATGNPKAPNADGGAYSKAGEPFTLAFRSLRWAPGRDDDSDGRWDGCSASDLSEPASAYARVPAWDIGQPEADLALPSAGSNAGLSYSDGNAAFAAAASSATATNVSYAEVGIIQLRPDSLSDFLGEPVELCSPYIGRFTPHHFTVISSSLTNRCDIATGTPDPFTYMGEHFCVDFDLSAHNADNSFSANYADFGAGQNFSKWEGVGALAYNGSLVPSFVVSANSDGTDLSSRLADITSTLTGSWNTGLSTIRVKLILARSAAPDGPFNAFNLGLFMKDSDEVPLTGLDMAIDTDLFKLLSSTSVRFGRAVLADSYGRETEKQRLFFWTHYFDGSGFVLNAEDATTAYSVTPADPSTDPTNPACSDPGTDPVACNQVSVGGTGITPGNFYSLSAPGPGNSGMLRYTLAVDPWLRFNWDGVDQGEDGDRYDDNPSANVSFGIFRGDDRFIYWREVE
jgi:MSHA biogenesis protein MshQ